MLNSEFNSEIAPWKLNKEMQDKREKRESYDDRLEKSYDLIKIRVIKLIS